jgi:hypothetical protein
LSWSSVQSALPFQSHDLPPLSQAHQPSRALGVYDEQSQEAILSGEREAGGMAEGEKEETFDPYQKSIGQMLAR